MSREPEVPGSPRPSLSRLASAAGALITFAGVLAIGLSAGWYAARQGGSPPGETQEGEAAEAGHPGPGHDAAPPGVRVEPRTLANLGVEVREARPEEFVLTRDVPAEVVLLSGARRPVHAPVSGRITRVLVEERQVVLAGDPLAEMLRDPFPRPTLTLTEGLLRPLNEEFHRSLSDLKSAVQALAIVRDELTRIRGILGNGRAGEAPSLPGKVEVDLRYEERRALQTLENARREAERHGLTPQEIAEVEAGRTLASDLPLAERVLARNHLWSEHAKRLLAALPDDVRNLPYAVAVLGELGGSGRLTQPLVEAVVSDPALAAAFLDVAGLVQSGLSVEGLRALQSLGALEPLVVLRAPAEVTSPRDWDVAALHVRPGAAVEAGTTAFDLVDARRTALRLSPAAAEMGLVAEAVRSASTVDAEPLVAGGGPTLPGLYVEQLPMADASGPSPGAALCPVENIPLCHGEETALCRFRSWSLRPGMRYVVHVSVARWPDRFVLPADAVVSRGADSVVMLADGDAFRPVVVRVEHRDARSAVVANDGALFPGDRVVWKGAYALSLALQAGSGGAVDPHAGHNH